MPDPGVAASGRALRGRRRGRSPAIRRAACAATLAEKWQSAGEMLPSTLKTPAVRRFKRRAKMGGDHPAHAVADHDHPAHLELVEQAAEGPGVAFEHVGVGQPQRTCRGRAGRGPAGASRPARGRPSGLRSGRPIRRVRARRGSPAGRPPAEQAGARAAPCRSGYCGGPGPGGPARNAGCPWRGPASTATSRRRSARGRGRGWPAPAARRAARGPRPGGRYATSCRR